MEKKLENALTRSEEAFEIAVKSAQTALKMIKNTKTAAQNGTIKEIPKSINLARTSLEALAKVFEEAAASWDFDEEAYFQDGNYIQELLAQAEEMEVSIFEQDGQMFCYPFLIRFAPNERVLKIDKTSEKRLKPSLVIKRLKVLQEKPVRFKPIKFLDSIYKAYELLSKSKKALTKENSIFLDEIYSVLTMLPGQSREYTKQEFARDIYLLDQSGVTATSKGLEMKITQSSGAKEAKRTLTVVTKSGKEKTYCGIRFFTP